MDNDKAGKQALDFYRELHNQVKDYSQIIYPNYKDLNEWFVQSHFK